MTVDQMVEFLVQRAPTWVRAQRDIYRPRGRPLGLLELAALQPFFDMNLLAELRLAAVPRIENPDFYSELAVVGIPPPLDLTKMQGITYSDTILISQVQPVPLGEWSSLLFHESVHAVQYQVLGVDPFLKEYIRGFAQAGFDYYANPLEHDAYDLAARFEASPMAPFAVAEEVRRRILTRSSAA
jgi:hypothetical protein